MAATEAPPSPARAEHREPVGAGVTYELWQTEWCPASRRVRQRLTELGIDYITRQVPVDKGDRRLLRERTGTDTIPVLTSLARRRSSVKPRSSDSSRATKLFPQARVPTD